MRVPERSAMENGEPVENERLLINIRTTFEEEGECGGRECQGVAIAGNKKNWGCTEGVGKSPLMEIWQ